MADKTYSMDVNSEKKIYRVKPPEARGSYMQRIIEPEAFEEGGTAEYGCQLRWPIDNPEVQLWAKDMAGLFRLIIADKYGKEKADKVLKKPGFKVPLRNGNNEDNEEYHGWLFMNVRNKFRQPIVMGPHAKALSNDLITDQIIYSGAWYRTRLIFRYYKQIGEGIGAYIDILMKTRDDDRLDSVINVGAAEEDFAGFATADSFDEVPSEDDKTEGGIEPSKDDDFSFL